MDRTGARKLEGATLGRQGKRSFRIPPAPVDSPLLRSGSGGPGLPALHYRSATIPLRISITAMAPNSRLVILLKARLAGLARAAGFGGRGDDVDHGDAEQDGPPGDQEVPHGDAQQAEDGLPQEHEAHGQQASGQG